MNSGPDSPLVGLVIGSVVYLLLSLVLISFLGGIPETLIHEMSDTYVNQIWSAWMTIGVLLFAADGIALLSFLTGGR
jgi:hypothetical protein